MISIQDQEFKQFSDFIRANYGIHFKDEKKSLVAGRLTNVLTSMKINNLLEYVEYIKADKTGQAASAMLDRITTNYTYFMREPEHFHFFTKTVLPYLSKTVTDRDLRVWSAACSTGEEPYTLAMVIDDFFGLNKPMWDTKILATDISQSALSSAKTGIYSNDKIASLPKAWKRKYFRVYDPDHSIISETLRNEVIFGNINLMDKYFPFKRKMHIIFCRNAMIYFDSNNKDKLVQRFYDLTEPGGFLFVGHSEGLNRERTRYQYIVPAVYRKE